MCIDSCTICTYLHVYITYEYIYIGILNICIYNVNYIAIYNMYGHLNILTCILDIHMYSCKYSKSLYVDMYMHVYVIVLSICTRVSIP